MLEPILFSAHGGRMDPSKLFRHGGVAVHRLAGCASDSDSSASIKLRPKIEGSELRLRVCLNLCI